MSVYAEILTKSKKKIAFNQTNSEGAVAHQHTKILLMLDGECKLACGGEEREITPGSIIVIPKGCDYAVKSRQNYRILSVSGDFDAPFLSDGIRCVQDNIYGEGRKLAELILYNRFGNEGYVMRLCDAYIEYILLNTDRQPKNTTAAIYKIISRMEKNFSNSALSIGALLDESGYARDYIRTEFELITKTTPKKYLNNIRMKNAKAMIELYGKEMSISEIAEKCGILDPSIFSRIYKKYYGISPIQYRDSLKQKQADVPTKI